MNELLSPGAIAELAKGREAERRRIQDALRRIAVRYQHGGCVIEEVAIRRAIEEIFDVALARSSDVRLEERAE